jgi:hypothetical protein
VRRAATWLAAGAAGLAALLLLRHWTPSGISTCLMYNLTGVPCPGCGMTRSCALLARGDVHDSLRFHPLGVVFAAQAAVAWTWWGLALWRRVRVPSGWWGVALLAADVLALGVVWLVRYRMHALPV